MKTGIYWQDPEYPAKGINFIFDPSLVLYLPLHRLDGASFRSQDKHGHLCTVTGALWRPQGRYFDGSDDVIDCGSKLMAGLSSLTIFVWVRPEDKSANHSVVGEFENNTFMAAFFICIDVAATGTYKINFAIKGENNARNDVAGDTTTIAYDEWHCIAATWDGEIQRVYLDGKEDGSGAYSDNKIETAITDNTAIGRYELDNPDQQFKNLIGEVAIYSRALTPLEIHLNYLATKPRYRA